MTLNQGIGTIGKKCLDFSGKHCAFSALEGPVILEFKALTFLQRGKLL